MKAIKMELSSCFRFIISWKIQEEKRTDYVYAYSHALNIMLAVNACTGMGTTIYVLIIAACLVWNGGQGAGLVR